VPCSLRRRILAVGLRDEVDQEACSSRQVFLYGSFADAEPSGDLLLRQVVHTSQPENFTAFVRKPVDGGRDRSELLADAHASLRRDLIYQDVEGIQILQQIDRHDTVSARPVDHEVPGSREEQRLRRDRAKPLSALENADVSIVADVLDVGAIGPHARDVAQERCFVREHFAGKPVIDRAGHGDDITSTARPEVGLNFFPGTGGRCPTVRYGRLVECLREGAMTSNSGKLGLSVLLSLLLTAAAAASQSDITIETVQVTATREQLREAIVTFVSNVTRRDGENVARWNFPICPSVSGATPEQGEFIRSRILEIAASVRAPVGRKEKCQPNLLVILTEQPAALWASWRARSPGMFFEQSQAAISRALETPRPVSAWLNAMVINADGTRGAEFNRLVDSHIKASVSEDIASVIVMVDTTATGGATFGQLADYIAMVALARIDLDADFGDAGSILRVFAKKTEGAPKRLTNWDHAFLKALYRPDRPLLRPRTDIVVTMREELAP
jgi:hypothetical protein